jgi:dephospho-CoA kinase
MLVIGLTGPTGAGKGVVANLFASFGLPILDADQIYHALLVPPSACLEELVLRFGAEILCQDGTLNRRALASLVFDSPKELADLNEIAHRHVMQTVRAKLEELRTQQVAAAVLDAPQLSWKLFASIVSVLRPLIEVSSASKVPQLVLSSSAHWILVLAAMSFAISLPSVLTVIL